MAGTEGIRARRPAEVPIPAVQRQRPAARTAAATAAEDIAACRIAVAALIPVGQRRMLQAAVITAADIAAHRPAEARIPAVQRPAARVAAAPTAASLEEDRVEVAPEAGRMEALRMADTVATKWVPPRFTPYLTHRQEALKRASCPP
jgi:hypothetical protein